VAVVVMLLLLELQRGVHRAGLQPTMLWYLKDYPAAFDHETISILSGALDDVWQVVEANKAAFRD
jgi:hypothetical protein